MLVKIKKGDKKVLEVLKNFIPRYRYTDFQKKKLFVENQFIRQD